MKFSTCRGLLDWVSQPPLILLLPEDVSKLKGSLEGQLLGTGLPTICTRKAQERQGPSSYSKASDRTSNGHWTVAANLAPPRAPQPYGGEAAMAAVAMGAVAVGAVAVVHGLETRSPEVAPWFCSSRPFNDVVSTLFLKIATGFWFSPCTLICDIMTSSEVRSSYTLAWTAVITRWLPAISHHSRSSSDLPPPNLIVLKESLSKRATWKPRMFFHIPVPCACSWLCVSLDSLSIWWKPTPPSEPSSNHTPVNLSQQGHSTCPHVHSLPQNPLPALGSVLTHIHSFKRHLLSYIYLPHVTHCAEGRGYKPERDRRGLFSLTAIIQQNYRLPSKNPNSV